MAKDLIASFLQAAEVFPSRPLTLQIGTTFGPFYLNLFSSRPRLVGTFTANRLTDMLTLTAHGLSNATMIQVAPATATSNLTDGLESGELYFAANVSANTIQLSTNPLGTSSSLYPVVDIKSNDSCRVYVCGTPYDLTDHKVWAWVKHKATDADNDLVLDLEPSITGGDYLFGYDWRATFSKTDTETFSLTPAVHVWSFLLEHPDGTRNLLIDNSRFTIALPTTHPNLIS